jgi:hypothetical protein
MPFSGSWSVIHVVHNVVNTKRVCRPLFLTLSSNYHVILLRIFHMGFLNVFYRRLFSWGNLCQWLELLGAAFIRNSFSKKLASLYSMMVRTWMSSTPEFIIKNLLYHTHTHTVNNITKENTMKSFCFKFALLIGTFTFNKQPQVPKQEKFNLFFSICQRV